MKASAYLMTILIFHCSFTSLKLPHSATDAIAYNHLSYPLQDNSSWIFLGQFSPSKKTWLSKYFDNDNFPEVGQTLKAIKPANKRRSLPLKENGYKLTALAGKIKTGESVKVQEVKALVGNFYWIKVSE